MRPLIFTILLFFSFTEAFAQQKIELSRQDSALVNKYLKISLKHDSLAHYRDASDFLNKVAFIYWEHNHFQQAIDYYNESLKRNEKLKNENAIAMISSNLALIYADMQEYDKALEYFEKTYSIRLSKKENIGIISSLINMSVVLNNLKQYNESTKKLSEALDIAREMNDPKQMCSCYGMLSETYDKSGNSKKAIHYFELYKTFHEMLQKNQIKKTKEEIENERLRAELAVLEKNKKEQELIVKKEELKEKTVALQESSIEIQDLTENLSKKELAIKLVKQNAEIEQLKAKQKIDAKAKQFNFALFTSLFLVFVALIFALAYRTKRRMNKQLVLRNDEIFQQKEKIIRQAENLAQANTKLKELDKMKQGLTGMLVHDLKNPLNQVINSSQKFEIEDAANQMIGIIDNMLDVQKYEEKEMPIQLKDHSLSSLISSSISQVKYLAKHKNISIENKTRVDKYIHADAEIVKRIFVNLLTNAIKYTQLNGEISIEFFEHEAESGFISIWVNDNGIGIASDKIDLVFDKFSQINPRKSGTIRSTGLGLTFCKMAVEAHGGEIMVESIPMKKTSFIFSLPVASQAVRVEVEKKESEKIEQFSAENLNLNPEEIDYLLPFVKKFENHSVYEISFIRKIIADLDENFSGGIKIWKKEMNSAAYNCNEAVYDKLLKIK